MSLSISFVFFFKQKTAYDMRISDWSSDVCSSDLALVRFAQYHSRPAPVIRRAAADVDGDIPDFTFQHAHQLALRLGILEMQAAQHALAGARDVALHEPRRQADGGELVLVEGFVEEAARSDERRVGKECVRKCRSRWS